MPEWLLRQHPTFLARRRLKRRSSSSEMQYRTLGRTGEKVSAIGLGGYHIGMQYDPAESVRMIRTAIDRGINFMDNCWDYNDGASESRMGDALKDGYRNKVLLMTKIDGRTKQSYQPQLEHSLARLKVDTIDLVQFHEIIRFEDPDRIFAAGGAMEAALAAQTGGQAPLHRLHRPQGPCHPPAHVRDREATQLPLRHRADARQCDGCAFPLVRQTGHSGGPARRAQPCWP